MLNDHALTTIARKDYRVPDFYIDEITLDIDLDPHCTTVISTLKVTRHTDKVPLVLHGENITLVSIVLDGVAVRDFHVSASTLTVAHVPNHCELTITTQCNPTANTSLMGLYVSRGNFFTQCEAEGFRTITYFLDRPDVMARYTVTLRADKTRYPVLLSNGNLIDSGDIDAQRHYAQWHDPFPKPCYLFALVAGHLDYIEEKIQTASGKNKTLQVWVEPKDLTKTRYALDSLIHALRWDEQRFGLELDLDRFMIVAVSDFNMGAMENKGLNIFNTKFVLADPDSATDADYANIEGVVAHEYFHNWTGNRVTCRDWFQLSLKEGLTVFRDQEFSADQMGSASGRAVKRIEDVSLLRQAQFPEDAGPMSHPVRPESYQEINNFYTLTVYEKGAEVVRMLQTLLGQSGFRRGMDLYFQRHDGQAVTCDDFLAAMADANERNLDQFSYWYSQAGTPRVSAQGYWNEKEHTYTLHLKQYCPPTPGQINKKPFHIPFVLALLNPQGKAMPLSLNTHQDTNYFAQMPTTQILELTQTEHTFVFPHINDQPTPSLLRNFSAPVILEYPYNDAELLHLLQHDDDAFNRWEAGQRLALTRLTKGIQAIQKGAHTYEIDPAFITALRTVLKQTSLDPALRSQMLTLPSESYLAEYMVQQHLQIDPQAIHSAREIMRSALSQALQEDWHHIYLENLSQDKYRPDAISTGKRTLKNHALAMLTQIQDTKGQAFAYQQFQQSDNMTDRFAALSALVHSNAPQASVALTDFYQRHKANALVIDKWFTLQVMCKPEASVRPLIEVVKALMQHAEFSLQNPNRARSVIHAFCTANPAGFHSVDGVGYTLWAEQVIAIDAINPQVAARLARALDRWRAFAQPWQDAMHTALLQVNAQGLSLSGDTREVITKALTAT
ncbi:MAG: aminopeptidase N [Ottowia sp.]|nr:aminopeptidase N [Ottowia sp.]